MKKSLLVGVAVLAGTCYAAVADYFVVQDTSTKQCRVVEQKPTGSTLVIVGGEGRIYATQGEAEAAMKNESACNQTAQAPTANQTAQSPKGNQTGQAPKSANPPSTTGAAPSGSVQIMNDVPANSMTITNYYKQAVYDPQNNRIGDVDDVLVTRDGRANALVIGVGGFLGIGEKNVIVPFNAVKLENKDNKVTLVMNSSKDELKAAPGFKYDRTKTSWVKEASR
jgi:sporulation protein YlmC with PRC-barrel domain